MSDFDNLKFSLELLDLMINTFEDIEFKADNHETIKRLEFAVASMKKAYSYASPIIFRKELL